VNRAGVPIEGFGDSTGSIDFDAVPKKAPSSA
jgi:hypothetical protein